MAFWAAQLTPTTPHVSLRDVVPYAAHDVPSYVDAWGWILASDQLNLTSSVEETDSRVKHRLDEKVKFLGGQIFTTNTTFTSQRAEQTQVAKLRKDMPLFMESNRICW